MAHPENSHTGDHTGKNNRSDKYRFYEILPPGEKHAELKEDYSDEQNELKNKEKPCPGVEEIVAAVISMEKIIHNVHEVIPKSNIEVIDYLKL